jgi:ABC-type bacteriocin/lantibiotic exporter with double-glycine peptidase domain
LVALPLGLAFLWQHPASALGSEQDPGGQLYRCSEFSGCNLLYLYAVAHGSSVNFWRIRELMSEGNRLATLRDIEVAANTIEITACVRKLTANDFESLSLPIITHLDGWNEEISIGGEFILVIARHGSVFEVLEGITCAPSIMAEEEFFKRWAGYAVVYSCDRGWQYTVTGLAGLLLILAVNRRSAAAKEALPSVSA